MRFQDLLRRMPLPPGTSSVVAQYNTFVALPTRLPGIQLSIQGNMGAYCDPRQALPADQYRLMEFALTKDAELMSWEDIMLQRELTDVPAMFAVLDNYADPGSETCVFGYVPVADIQTVWDAIGDDAAALAENAKDAPVLHGRDDLEID